jgi:hypothetical protein
MMDKLGKLKILAITLVGLLIIFWLIRTLLSEDRENQISRLGVSYIDRDYRVTYSAFSGDKTWTVYGGKITSEPSKGYYFFWATNLETQVKFYVQVPIENTIIEEIK